MYMTACWIWIAPIITAVLRAYLGGRQDKVPDEGMNRPLKAGILAGFMIFGSRIAVGVGAGWIMLLPFAVALFWIVRLSPPVSGIIMIFGWALFAGMDFPATGYIPRIPAITVLILSSLLFLIYWSIRQHGGKSLLSLVIQRPLLILTAFLSCGLLRTAQLGLLANPLIRFYVYDSFRTWLGFLALGILCCRSIRDFKVIVFSFPFAFLIYPLQLPLHVWAEFFTEKLWSQEVLNVGLGFGALNTNTLGQAAALAAVLAGLVLAHNSSFAIRAVLVGLFAISEVIVLMTSSRQALLAFIAGLILLGIFAWKRGGFLWIACCALIFAAGVQGMIFFLPRESGIKSRLVEVTQDVGTWESQSASVRLTDMEEAVNRFREAPVFGVGFGAQQIHELPADNETTTLADYNRYAFSLRGTHNLFLGILAQTGLLGLTLFLWFAASVVKSFFKTVRLADGYRQDDLWMVKTAVYCLLACLLLQYNISGGLGMGSYIFMFLMGAMIGVKS